MNSDIHFGSTITSISHTEPLQSTMTQPMFESEHIHDLGLLQNAKAHGPEMS